KERPQTLIVLTLEINEIIVELVIHLVAIIDVGIVIYLHLIEIGPVGGGLHHSLVPGSDHDGIAAFQKALGVISLGSGHGVQPAMEAGLDDDDFVLGLLIGDLHGLFAVRFEQGLFLLGNVQGLFWGRTAQNQKNQGQRTQYWLYCTLFHWNKVQKKAI